MCTQSIAQAVTNSQLPLEAEDRIYIAPNALNGAELWQLGSRAFDAGANWLAEEYLTEMASRNNLPPVNQNPKQVTEINLKIFIDSAGRVVGMYDPEEDNPNFSAHQLDRIIEHMAVRILGLDDAWPHLKEGF